ncbi:glycosyltransferase family A protein [Anoxybacillus sp. FSL W8-1294]|uniref:glycosyltransferase family 2 protein n=1 Tax=Anoxybacillus sp. FSL W8-1294 TaxID=2954655 RepID=UPI0030D0FB1C
MDPKVSVIITSYNSNESFLKIAIESVLHQTYPNIELILVDDGSNNNSAKKLCEFHKEIKYIRQSNKGLPAARNTGIRNSSGEYICFLDDDDYWHEEKVEKQVIQMEKISKEDPNVGMTFTYTNVINMNGDVIGKYGYKVKGNIFNKLLLGNIVGAPSSVMIKRGVLEHVGLFNEEFRYAEDIELWYRVAYFYTIYSTDEYLLYYRWRDNSHSKNAKFMNTYLEKALKNILEMYHDHPYIKENKCAILSNLYKSMANRYFWSNDINNFKDSYFKFIKVNKRNILNIKMLTKYLMSTFLPNLVLYKNNLRSKKEWPGINGIIDYT